MKAIFDCFNLYGVIAVQIGYDIVQVSFTTDAGFKHAEENSGIRLFGLWCPILGGGPPLTTLHIFDFPFEEDDANLKRVCSGFGEVKSIKKQKNISDPNIFTGTRLVSVALSSSLPRSLTIGGYVCRVWYRGQPLVCNLCAVQGHMSVDCPNKDKCCYGATGHFARNCKNAWGTDTAGQTDPPSERTSGEGLNAPGEASVGYASLASISEAVVDAPRAPAVVDPPDAPAGSSQEDRPPVQALGDSNISASDDYLFTCGQPMSEDAAPQPVAETTDSQCVAAEALVSAGQIQSAKNVENVESNVVQNVQNATDQVVVDQPVVETCVIDEGDSNSASQSILQNIQSPVLQAAS